MALPVTMDWLPNEILMAIFSSLPTRSLLPLAEVNRHFHSVVLRVLHYRLLEAAALPEHRLILECYHPSAKLSTPYVFCDYLSTDSPSAHGTVEDQAEGGLAGLNGMYSHFRPVAQAENRRARLRYPGQVRVQQQNQVPDPNGQAGPSQQPAVQEVVSLDIHLDEGEPFSQLCTVTNIVKAGPKHGLFLSHVNVSEGVIRVWRDWLASRAVPTNITASETQQQEQRDGNPDPILWADSHHHVGIRFRVVEKEETAGMARPPLLVQADEDLPASYRLEFEELLVRTNRLLLMMEQSEVQEITASGKAIVIASM